MNLPLRPLGSSGLSVSAAGLGCARLGGTAERFDEKESLWILARAREAGINFFDTADIYAQGHSERLLGRAFAGCRDRVVLASKGGYMFSSAAGFVARFKPLLRKLLKFRPGLASAVRKARGGQMRQDFSPAHLTAAVEASLRRLGTDYLDLYQLHSPPAEVLREGAIFTTLGMLKTAGKIRSYGVSCLFAEDAALCLAAGVSALQIEASVAKPAAFLSALPATNQAGVATIVRQPFGSGLLLRSPDSWTADDFGGDPGALDAARARLAALRSLGDPTDWTLRYLLRRPDVTTVLFATTRREHLEKNLRILAAPPLTSEETALIDRVLSPSASDV